MAVKRKYDSSARRARAAATRRKVIDAAAELFVREGYAGATVRQIAQRAGVSPETVYGRFGSKADLLEQVVAVRVVGDDAPVPLAERPWVHELRDHATLEARLGVLAEHGTEVIRRAAPLMHVVRAAAASDELVAALLERMDGARRRDSAHVLRLLAGDHPLCPGASFEEAVDWFHALTGDQLFVELTDRRGWTIDRYRAWLGRAIRSTIFAT